MSERDSTWQKIIGDLTERAKELKCLYAIEELLKDSERELAATLQELAEVMPQGWQYSHLCRARLRVEEGVFTSADFVATRWAQSAAIRVEETPVGEIEVFYVQEVGAGEHSPFLPEEQRLLDTIADRVGHYLFQRRLKGAVEQWATARKQLQSQSRKQWEIVVDLLEKTDPKLFAKISRKMLNYLCWIGVEEARLLLQSVTLKGSRDPYDVLLQSNKPSLKKDIVSAGNLSRRIFGIARGSLSDEEILDSIQKWVKENRVGFLVKALENLDTSLGDLLDAISRYHHMEKEDVEITPYTRHNINVLLIHRLFTENLDFIDIARDYADLEDFYDILRRTIFPQNSHGRLGGKSAGLFIAAQIIKRYAGANPELGRIEVPKTWYVSSDVLQTFLSYNDLEEILEQKYKAIEQIREEYPNIVQVFKNAVFPAEIVNWLSACLDDFGARPIIVRSSSLLEDRMGSAFSGKYKSLFLANQGTKPERLNSLMDAISEVYASVFAPDPIEYRRERGLTNFHEEMGIMIQEVVGARVGPYFFPEFAGVAFSHNEFRWSPRIRREDGLARLVPGLGTRAVDRLSDDYPKLLAIGQPALNVNATPDEILHYSPHQIDVIDLENNSFATLDFGQLLHRLGDSYPNIEKIVSVNREGLLRRASRVALDFEHDEMAATFEGIISASSFVKDLKSVLDLLREKLGRPVDVEFAVSQGTLYLLQCRTQSASSDARPVPIPRHVPPEKTLFTARKYVSNGLVPAITHVVYVDPERYGSLETPEAMQSVGRVIGRLNSLLPKRQFILVGPGRWGSRGDIKLGVPVSYSEINNTALLVEVARRKGNYVPDLSFGTHFFQDLVEAGIRYLPLYPDEPQIIFNEQFLLRARNVLPQLLPEHEDLGQVIRVVDVPAQTAGEVLHVAMNAERDEAMAYFGAAAVDFPEEEPESPEPVRGSGEHWRWRLRSAQRIARELDPRRFAVKGMYVIGSTKNATASAASDIDLLVHFGGTEEQKRELLAWLEGWSLSLAEVNYMRTGFRTDRLLDVHLVTDEDIDRKSSYAVKIGAVTDPAQPLELGR